MLKLLAAGATALFVTLSPTAFAQAPSAMGPARLGQADLAKLTDERIAIVKSVLQLTPDQEKYAIITRCPFGRNLHQAAQWVNICA
jgi:hypothetical protein